MELQTLLLWTRQALSSPPSWFESLAFGGDQVYVVGRELKERISVVNREAYPRETAG